MVLLFVIIFKLLIINRLALVGPIKFLVEVSRTIKRMRYVIWEQNKRIER